MTPADLRRYDADDMYEAIRGFPEQWRVGRERALEAPLDDVGTGQRQGVVVAGMGGSAIGGDLLRTLAADSASTPIVVSRSYTLPAWVGPQSTVIASSYSGHTEETLSAMDDALDRGAEVICITSGGEVQRRAERHGLPCVLVPGGMQPRAALGYSLTALLTIAERMELLRVEAADWDEAGQLLEYQSDVLADPEDNQALRLAQDLDGTLPLIYAGAGMLEAVALRWQTQIHENAKTLATGNLFPELNHNEIMGWERATPVHDQLSVVVLRDPDDHPQVQRRIDATRALVEAHAATWVEVEAEEASPLARVISLVNLGDWVSFYLAMCYGVDPTPVGLISTLKATLAS